MHPHPRRTREKVRSSDSERVTCPMSTPRRRRRDVASSDHSTDADLDELRRRSSEIEGVDRSDAHEAARLSNLIFERTRAYRLAIIRPYANVHSIGLWIAFAAFTAAGWKDVRSGVSLGPVPIRSPLGYLVAYAWALAFLAALVFKVRDVINHHVITTT